MNGDRAGASRAAMLAPRGVGDDMAANALSVQQRALLEEQARRMRDLEALSA